MDTASGFVIENNVLKKYVGPGADVVIPEGVAHIGAHAFQDNTDLISVSVPDSVLSICGGAFACRQRLNILHSVFSQDLAPALAFYDRQKKIKPKDFEKEWLEPAENAGAVQRKAWLLDWRSRHKPRNAPFAMSL